MPAGEPDISVIIPTFNRERSIAECVRSVLAQSHAPLEILVVDDGSEDRTIEILLEFGDKIKIIQKENGGVSSARNAGIKAAKGDWVAFLDSDDIWYENRLSVFVSDYQHLSFEGVGAHISNIAVEVTQGEDNLFEFMEFEIQDQEVRKVSDPLAIALKGVFSDGLIARKSIVENLGGFDVNYTMYEDMQLYARLALRGSWVMNNTLVGCVRRLQGDAVALTYQEVTRQEYVASRYLALFKDLLAESLTNEQMTLVRKKQSGAYLDHARVMRKLDPAKVTTLLMEAARVHPSFLKGWCKSFLPLVFGDAGFRFLFKNSKTSFR